MSETGTRNAQRRRSSPSFDPAGNLGAGSAGTRSASVPRLDGLLLVLEDIFTSSRKDEHTMIRSLLRELLGIGRIRKIPGHGRSGRRRYRPAVLNLERRQLLSAFNLDGSGNLWVGTYGHGLHRFDRGTGEFSTYRHNPADPHSLSNDIVMRLLVDHHGTLWAGTADGQIGRAHV